MANEISATATISFSPTPSVQILNATSTVIETPTTKRFVRMIGLAPDFSQAIPLATNVYPILGGTPGWLWVKNIDPIGEFIYIFVVNPDQISYQYGLEIARLYPGEAMLVRIGRGMSNLGAPTGVANYMITGSDSVLYDAVIMAA